MRRCATLFAPILLAVALALMPGPSPAQQRPQPAPSATSLIEAARGALAKGRPDHAALLLEGVKPGEGDVDDLDFLHGSIAMQQGDWQAAIDRFRAMLARNPDLPRVRLDLALAYFQAEEDGNAAYHFRLALGTEDLPALARARALSFLDRIRRRKSWSVTGAVSIAPDTNINAATSAREVKLFGLPARLSEDGRETGGVGLNADISGRYEAKLAEDVRLGATASLQTLTYRQSDYNDRILSLQVGPRFLFEGFDLRPELTVRQRWLGGNDYSRDTGLELSGNWHVAPAWRLNGSLGGRRVAYESFLDDGRIYSVRIGAAHALGQATLLRGFAGFQREKLDLDAYSWSERIVGISASRELPRGFVVNGGPTWRWRKYDAPLASLGPERRTDRTIGVRVAVSNRYVELLGFMPELSVRYERRDSNLALYDYDRTAAELRFVRTF